MDNKEFVQGVVDILINQYGDALVFEVFLETWEPLEVIKEAVETRIEAKKYKRVRNRVRYNHRDLILKADDYTCVHCNEKFPAEELEVDHLVPIENGGDESFENSATSCGKCNNRRGNREVADIDPQKLKDRREGYIMVAYPKAGYMDFKEEYEREGKIRGRDRFIRSDG